jgi:hydroxybutyrate-dimer hydrolase
VGGYGKPLYDYFSFANLYQPCAALAPEAAIKDATGAYEVSTYDLFNPSTPSGALLVARATARCAALAANGLVTGADTASQATDALNRLRNYGWGPYNDTMHNAHYGLGNAWIVTSMYANAYGRFSVADNLCNVSFAGADATGSPAPLATATAATPLQKAQSFAVANGTANGTPAAVIINNSVGGAKRWELATSPSTAAADFGFDSALCLRALYTGTDPRTNTPLTASTTPTLEQSQRVRTGVAETLATANLHGKPTLIVSGRSDALLPVNNAARAYVAANRVAEGAASPVRYVEVTNGQHFDGFLGFPGFDTRFIPLHVYFVDALNAMYANLKSGTALPPSQVVRTTPRGGTPGAAPAPTRAVNLPAITATPAATDAITFSGNAINVPN